MQYFLALTFSTLLLFNTLSAVESSYVSSAEKIDKEELAMLNDLITVTQQSLGQQKALRDLIVEYQDAQKLYIKSNEDPEMLFRCIKLAHYTLKNIQENNLQYAFTSEFLKELTLFDQVASKHSIPKPQSVQ